MQREGCGFVFILMIGSLSLSLFFSSCVTPGATAFMQGKSQYNAGNYQAARDLFVRAMQMEPTNWLHHHWLGWTYLNLGKYQQAVDQLNIANNIKELAENYLGLGQAYHKMENFESALANLKRYVQMKPQNAAGYHWLGWTYLNLGKYQQAANQFNIANNLKEDADNYSGLGQAYYNMENYESALANLKRWVQMKPQNAYGYHWLGWTYLNLGNYQGAVNQFNIANNLKENASNYRGLGEAYSKLGHDEEADTAFSNALKLAADEKAKENLKYSIALIYLEQGDSQKAYDVLGPKPILGIGIEKAEEGLKIRNVFKGSPASLAGIETGDVLTEFAGRHLMGLTHQEFTEEIHRTPYGSQVKVLIRRDGRRVEKLITVGIIPPAAKTGQKRLGSKKPGVRWAVIVGISAYQDTQIPSLRYAASDAMAFYEWAVSPHGGKYAPSRVKLLINEEATGLNIKQALFEWLRTALEEDMVMIYFAGHGSPASPDSQRSLYLLPYDTKYTSIATTAFPMWDIETALKHFIKARKVVVIADACHSGGVGRSFDIARRSNRAIQVNPISSALQGLSQVGDGVCVISASSDRQFSQESEMWGGGHGVFTYFLLNGLKGDADYNQDRSISLGELTSYLSEQVRRETRNEQSPTVSGRYDPALTLGE